MEKVVELIRILIGVLSPAVIYDGCPKTITQGIWWPRTKFNLPAAVPCPKGSVGPYTLTQMHSNTLIFHCEETFKKNSCFSSLQVLPLDTVMRREAGWSRTFATALHLRLWSSVLLYVDR